MFRRFVPTLFGAAVIVGLTLYVVHFGFTLHPFAPKVTRSNDLRPTVLHAIRQADQLVTAERQVDQQITKSAKSPLPGSTETITYLAVYDVKAGVDLSQITEQDVTVEGDTVRIALPPPFIISQALDAQQSHVISRSEGPTAFIGGPSKELLDVILRDAEGRARLGVLDDGTLLQAAQENAATDLRRLLNAAGIANVVFVPAPLPTAPAPTGFHPITVTPAR